MASFYLSSISPYPDHGEGNQGHDHLLLSPTSQTSSFPCIYLDTAHNQGDHSDEDQKLQQQQHKREGESKISSSSSWCGGQNRVQITLATDGDDQDPRHQYMKNSSNCRTTVNKLENENATGKWMSSKMRFVRKTSREGQQTCLSGPRSPPFDCDKSSNSNNTAIRVCSDCNTTKTPLWRSGPRGPKSLCNACGIRQRKARRALAVAAAAAVGSGMVPGDSLVAGKGLNTDQLCGDYTTQHKKWCKSPGPSSRKKPRFDDFTVSLSKNLALHQMFPQDEKDAAMLLMALSYGLVHG